jgi:trk system potassium uptake protein TrkA
MKVVIAGAGSVGSFIAEDLSAAGHDVVVIEQEAARVAVLRDRAALSRVTWVVGDACEVSSLQLTSPHDADVVAAVTGDDEDNLVISLLAKQEFAVPRVLARVNHPENHRLFDQTWGVDVSVSTPHLLSALVEEAVSVGTFVRLLSLANGKARLVEVTLAPDAPIVGREVAGAGFPRDSTVVAVVRHEGVVVPRGDTVFYAGDEVLVLVTDQSEDAVRTLLIG